MVVGAVVFDPANHRNPEWGFTYHLEDAKPLLSQGDDVAAVVVLALALENFGAAAHRRHCLALRIPAHHSKTPVRFQNGAQHHAITRLKDMEWQDFLREQHHIRQGEEWQFPHGQMGHGGNLGVEEVGEAAPAMAIDAFGDPRKIVQATGSLGPALAGSIAPVQRESRTRNSSSDMDPGSGQLQAKAI